MSYEPDVMVVRKWVGLDWIEFAVAMMMILSNMDSANAAHQSGHSILHQNIDEGCGEGCVVQDGGSDYHVQ
jgi:hypothetical protein